MQKKKRRSPKPDIEWLPLFEAQRLSTVNIRLFCAGMGVKEGTFYSAMERCRAKGLWPKEGEPAVTPPSPPPAFAKAATAEPVAMSAPLATAPVERGCYPMVEIAERHAADAAKRLATTLHAAEARIEGLARENATLKRLLSQSWDVSAAG